MSADLATFDVAQFMRERLGYDFHACLGNIVDAARSGASGSV
jgi:hypothetical protein